ncbi:MAG: hypothetical protein FWG38_06185, partial [Defluviitaleaceae bacterium]|nr:hypothetical protein [Defluviitaleaceae bacterium]
FLGLGFALFPARVPAGGEREGGARRKGDNVADRAQWAKYYTGRAKEYGIPCIWWDNGILEGPDNSEVFGLMNRKTEKWEFPEIVNAFLQK